MMSGALLREVEAQEAEAKEASVSSLSSCSNSYGANAATSATSADAAAGAAGDASDTPEPTKWVERPVDHVRWILGQRLEMHPTPSIEDYELYRTHDPVRPTTGFSQASIDARRELFVSLRESHDDFFEYQASVREVFERNDRVMEEVLGPRDDLQAEIDDIWARAGEEYVREHPELLESDSDQEECDEEEHA